MIKITRFECEELSVDIVTDERNPHFSFATTSDRNGAKLKEAILKVNGWTLKTTSQISLVYEGKTLDPFTRYEAELVCIDDLGDEDRKTLSFTTGRLDTPWTSKFITDGSYKFKGKTSPIPMLFKKEFKVDKKVKEAYIYSTAIGVYDLKLNGKKVGEDYFKPGFTSYKHQLQYQAYDIKDMLQEDNRLSVTVSGGWAVGRFIFASKNKIIADRQSFMAEIRIVYDDGSIETIPTDTSWLVSTWSPLRFADFYDGEVYDGRIDDDSISYHSSSIEKVKIHPDIIATYGSLVKEHEVFKPNSVKVLKSGEIVYDFGQNFAGILSLKIKGRDGQKITVKHAEVLKADGSLNTAFLRSAKAQLIYTCKEGYQEYKPSLTYMGFRYASISGIDKEDIEVEAIALYSDIKNDGSFTCSDSRINQLQSNITWSGKSNFVDIPTDCPQRDERMGWTGDIAVFASTACYNFSLKRFLTKWLKDCRSEQLKSGGLPQVVPTNGFGFPATFPKKAVSFWGEASTFVPFALYQKTGDINILKDNYEMMKRYVKAEKFWASFGFGKNRYIWHDMSVMEFGDWVAGDVDSSHIWQKRSKWTNTCAFKASCSILAKVASILGYEDDEKYYSTLANKISDAYVSILTDKNGRLKNEFQSAYVLPLYFDMFPSDQKEVAAKNLEKLAIKASHTIGTGFPGTPYLLFALADNGCKDEAFKMLLNDKCPSWLYEVDKGATTIWERWNGLDENGRCACGEDGTGGMVSFNHYAFGAVGDFLYRRVLGLEATSGGYKTFIIKPMMGGNITSASGKVETPYGTIRCNWKIEGELFSIDVDIPMATSCRLTLPSGKEFDLENGSYSYSESISLLK